MKRSIYIVFVISLFLFISCYPSKNTVSEKTNDVIEEITIMHIDAGSKDFQNYIIETEKKLNIKINVKECPQNPDNRHIKIFTLLASGDQSIDIITVNDEMVNEFKKKGYLEEMDETILPQAILEKYPPSYLAETILMNGKAYSVPFFMDIMMFWVNQSLLKKAGITEVVDKQTFDQLLKYNFENGVYGYGGAWEDSYSFNELSLFIHLFGGNYLDWDHPKTKEAIEFLKDIFQKKYVPSEILLDQYEQMNQKFLDGKYASVFAYSGTMKTYFKSGQYSDEYIHLSPIPAFGNNTTHIASWQYILNKSSIRKESAKKFLAYAASKEGSLKYCQTMNRLPARLDIIQEEELSFPDYSLMKEYALTLELNPRLFSDTPMHDIHLIGEAFKKFILSEISYDEFSEIASHVTH